TAVVPLKLSNRCIRITSRSHISASTLAAHSHSVGIDRDVLGIDPALNLLKCFFSGKHVMDAVLLHHSPCAFLTFKNCTPQLKAWVLFMFELLVLLIQHSGNVFKLV